MMFSSEMRQSVASGVPTRQHYRPDNHVFAVLISQCLIYLRFKVRHNNTPQTLERRRSLSHVSRGLWEIAGGGTVSSVCCEMTFFFFVKQKCSKEHLLELQVCCPTGSEKRNLERLLILFGPDRPVLGESRPHCFLWNKAADKIC